MVRESNQDAFLVAEPLFAVADGMGGHQGGEVASATALEVLKASFTEYTKENLLEAVRRANAKVWDKGQLEESLHGMGTTLTAVAKLFDAERNEDVLALINVGDSRGYLLRDGELTQVTTDHSLVEEMMAAGEITAEEAETHPRRNILTRALGVEPVVEADLEQMVPQVGDRILLCSDGLVREISDEQVAAILRRLKSPDEAARELVARAKAAGGHDNITVVIVDVEDEPRSDSAAVPAKKKSDKPVKGPKVRKTGGRLTFRTLAFLIAVIALLAGGAGSVIWYARASFYVGLEGEQVTIYRGRPQPVLWYKATVAQRTNILTTDLLPNDVSKLRAGASQVSLNAAHTFVENLAEEAAQARAVANPNAPTAAPEVIYQDATASPTTPTSVDPTATSATPAASAGNPTPTASQP